MSEQARIAVELLGGPYDGARGLYLYAEEGDYEDDEIPEALLIGVCRGGGQCGMPACSGNVGRHVAFWLVDEDEPPPVATLEYRKAGEERLAAFRGRARYVFAGLELPGALEEAALAGAGAFGGLTYGER